MPPLSALSEACLSSHPTPAPSPVAPVFSDIGLSRDSLQILARTGKHLFPSLLLPQDRNGTMCGSPIFIRDPDIRH